MLGLQGGHVIRSMGAMTDFRQRQVIPASPVHVEYHSGSLPATQVLR
jgi:hypothetical protein